MEQIYVTYSSAAAGAADHAIINYIDSSGNHFIIQAGPFNTTLTDLQKAEILLSQALYGPSPNALGPIVVNQPQLISDTTQVDPNIAMSPT